MKTQEQQAQIIALELLRDMETGDTFDFVDVSMIYETNFAVAIRAVDILYCMNYVEAVENVTGTFYRTAKKFLARRNPASGKLFQRKFEI